MNMLRILSGGAAFAALMTAATAQVRLIYEVNDERLPVVALQGGAPCYLQGTSLRPAPAGGHYAFEAAPTWSDLDHEFHFDYRMRAKRPDEMRAVGDPTHLVGYNFMPGRGGVSEFAGCFYVAAWEVNGELRHVQVRPATFVFWSPPTDMRMELRPDEAGGVFRCYIFDSNGRSLAGEKKRTPELRQFRAALDAADKGRLKSWCAEYAGRVALSPELLQQLVRVGDIVTLEAVVAGKTRVNTLSDSGHTALQVAAQMGNLAAVDVLLKAGAKLDDGPRTALCYAVQQDAADVVERLLAAGAKTFPRDEDRLSPIGVALDNGNVELATRLLAADPKRPTLENLNSWLARAAQTNRVSSVDFLLANGADAKGRVGGVPLLTYAVERGNLELVKRFISAGADVNERPASNLTALMFAAMRGHEAVVEQLLASGADPMIEDSMHWTAAAQAAAFAPPEISPRLTRRLITVKPLSERQKSAVLFGALSWAQNADFADWLVREQGAKLDLSEPKLDYLLRRACESGAVSVCRQAVALGVSPSKKLAPGWTFAALARYYEMKDVLADMAARGGNLPTDYPRMVKDPVQIIEAPNTALPEEIARGTGPFEADVELMIAPDGAATFPRLKRVTVPALAPIALRQAAQMRFNPAASTDGWRHIVVPLSFKRENVSERMLGIGEQVDLAPIWLPVAADAAASASGPLRAAWVMLTVTETGAVVAPHVIASTDGSTDEEALAAVARWRYQPAQKHGNPIGCRLEEVVLLPTGRALSTGDLQPADEAAVRDFQLPQLKKVWWTEYPESLRKRRTTGVAVMRYTITTDGRARNPRVLCSTDGNLAEGLKEYLDTWRLEPAKRNGKAVDFEAIQAFVYRP